MRDPHRSIGYQLAKAFRDAFHTSTKEPTS